MHTSFTPILLLLLLALPIGCGQKAATDTSKTPISAEQQLAHVLKDYQTTMECVTPVVLLSPYRCMKPSSGSGAVQSLAAAKTAHGQKLFHLFSNDPEAYKATVANGTPAPIGLILLKETHESIEFPAGMTLPEHLNPAQYPGTRVRAPSTDQGTVLVPGEIVDLFFMAKVGTDSALQTDNGWLYGSMDLNGKINTLTSVGNCAECHQKAQGDRVIGLPKSTTLYINYKSDDLSTNPADSKP